MTEELLHNRLFDIRVPMRDGVTLATDVALPSTRGAWPTILVRTPYMRVDDRLEGWASAFNEHGFAFVAQDVRGRGDSDGEWTVFSSEFDDGYDTIEWLAEQSWCDGQVGMLGGSYEAWVQWAAASRKPKHLAALATSGSPGRWFRDWPFRYGGFYATDYLFWLEATAGRINQAFPFPSWAWAVEQTDLRTFDAACGRTLTAWQEALEHETYDEYWHSLDIGGYEEMDLPALHVTGWWDGCAPGQYHHFHEMTDRSPASDRQSLVVGPWEHIGACWTGEPIKSVLPVGTKGKLDMMELWLRWFSTWLKHEEVEKPPRVRYFCLGANDWHESEAWPPTDSEQRSLYLCADGRLADAPEEQEQVREYDYDPRDAIQSTVDLFLCEPMEWWAPRTDLLIANRGDVLVYSTGTIDAPITIAGPASAVLFASSSCLDTDFVVSLCYVPREGSAAIFADGILKASMRDSLSSPTPLEPGEIYKFEIEINDLALRLDVGDELRMVVSSSLVPYYHPNPNTGKPLTADWEPVVARQTIYHGSGHPSHLKLFVTGS